LIKILSVYQ